MHELTALWFIFKIIVLVDNKVCNHSTYFEIPCRKHMSVAIHYHIEFHTNALSLGLLGKYMSLPSLMLPLLT